MSHHFTLIKETTLPELGSTARLYRHEKTGARLLSIINDDENKCFSINFRTPPNDSTGVAHILEHSVLNGSQKYPVKEPFVELLKGSLATFINAFTFPDKTCYPVASQNLRDFYNLIDVYMDAVFHPLISPMTFQQEGWHYEIDKPDDPLTFKGVVFNEMKGAYSSPERVQEQEILTALFPEHTYGLSSGGAPEHIPELSYDQFKRFHQTWYHPSNAYIFFYGDDDPEERLKLMETYLKSYEMLEVDSAIEPVKAPNSPAKVEVPYDAGQNAATGKKAYYTINWALPDHSDPIFLFSMDVLAHVLIGTPASPLRKSLIDSGLGEDLTGLGLEETEHRELLFSTGLKGISKMDAPEVEKVVNNTLQNLAREGIDPQMTEAALNTIEFQLRENNTGAFPRGLSMMVRVMTTWLYDQDPLTPVAFEKPFIEIRQKLVKDKRYFEGLIQKYLLDNPFRADVLLVPDGNLAKAREDTEKARLTKIRSDFSDAQIQQLIESTQALKKRQETPDTPEGLASLPLLKLDDLDKKIKKISLVLDTKTGVEILQHGLFTNGIVYLDLGFDLSSLPAEMLPLVSVFGRALLEMGTEKEDYVSLLQRIGRNTGGIESQPLCLNGYQNDRSITRLFLRSKATLNQAGEMLAILADILQTARLDNPERFKQIVLEQKASIETQLSMRGDGFVYKRMSAHFNRAGWASEQIGGVTALLFLRKLVEEIDRDWASVLTRLEKIRKLLITRRGLVCNVTIPPEDWPEFSKNLNMFLGGLPDLESKTEEWERYCASPQEALVIPSQVNYVGKAANLTSEGYQLDGSVEVIVNHLRMSFLWEKIRVQGGAYGAFCIFNNNTGILSLISFRDPNVDNTLDNYTRVGKYLEGIDAIRLTDEELLKGIIGAIGLLDSYLLPDAKGFSSMQNYLSGETDEKRQEYRDQVLSATRTDFNKFGLFLDKAMKTGIVVAVGAQTTLEKAKAALTITKVL
jgi:Zn-dependent M16 (insulinase) family peptidase